MPRTNRVQCQYQYADTRQQHETPTARPPDDRHNRPHDPMTTPDDTTTPNTTRPTDRDATTETTSPRQIPGRTPITEEAGAPLVPDLRPSRDSRSEEGSQ
jgi:hypothetical protein